MASEKRGTYYPGCTVSGNQPIARSFVFSLPECVCDVLDGGVRPDDAVVLGQHLQPQQPPGALPPQLGHFLARVSNLDPDLELYRGLGPRHDLQDEDRAGMRKVSECNGLFFKDTVTFFQNYDIKLSEPWESLPFYKFCTKKTLLLSVKESFQCQKKIRLALEKVSQALVQGVSSGCGPRLG